MEEINATMMAKIEIVSLIYRENENTHLFFKQTDKVHIGTDHFQLNYYFYLIVRFVPLVTDHNPGYKS